jgi:hypothetical protein
MLQESLSQDYHATYWQQRYSLRRDIPGFLASSAETILTTGKYLNAVRECGHSIQVCLQGLFFYCLLSILSPVIFVVDPLFAE